MPRDTSAFKLVTVAAALIVGIFVVASLFSAIPANTEFSATNETHTISSSPSEYFELTHEEIDKTAENLDVLHVYNATGGEVGTSYYNVNTSDFTMNVTSDWNTSTGADGTDLNATYTFDNKPETSRDTIGTIGTGFNLGGIIPLVVAAVIILGYITTLNRRR